MHILLAEDEQDMSRVLAAIFKHEGYDIDVAANGRKRWIWQRRGPMTV